MHMLNNWVLATENMNALNFRLNCRFSHLFLFQLGAFGALFKKKTVKTFWIRFESRLEDIV